MSQTHPSAAAPQTGSGEPIVGEPVWELALMHPMQGRWTHEDYLSLTDHTNTLIEYTEGRIEFLAMPTIEHQLIVKFLVRALDAFVEPQSLGIVLFAPTRVYLEPNRYREPDVVFNFSERHANSGKRYYNCADLVMEVVSDDEGSRKSDLEVERHDYAVGGISEYWIVDPEQQQVTVLTLKGKQYATHGQFGLEDQASSKLLEGFSIRVDAICKAARQ